MSLQPYTVSREPVRRPPAPPTLPELVMLALLVIIALWDKATRPAPPAPIVIQPWSERDPGADYVWQDAIHAMAERMAPRHALYQ